ncbi:DinB family protein [Paenibacillus tarimensis]|uniref:DinB family protein n=1 Tax=Paenibacillus tarimensis TaxID=416012 RepID=UPI001F1AA4E4|nr:DinB family protein [Paenibacillus tarimensis]MCF2944751.1 DinB family protein [Paenibacillus tarimensis]
MDKLFRMNWQLRDGWFVWCENVPQIELAAVREGGHGSILQTLFHIIDMEQSWMRSFAGRAEHHFQYEDYSDLDAIMALSDRCRPFIEDVVTAWSPEKDLETFSLFGADGRQIETTCGYAIRYVASHETYHLGQLSIWARQLGYDPVDMSQLLTDPQRLGRSRVQTRSRQR